MRDVFAFLSLFFLSCREGAYNQASKTDNVTTWRNFIEANPSDINREAAEARLDELEFEEAQRAHTIVAYKRFLSTFPESPSASRAKKSLETLRFNVAVDKNGLESWRQFLSEHPDGAHRDEALSALSLLEEGAISKSSPAELAALRTSKDNPRVAETLEAQRDTNDFSAASSTAQYLAYLQRHPAGAHRDDVKAKLLNLEAQSLLWQGQLDEAKLLVLRNPLGNSLTGFKAEVTALERFTSLANGADLKLRAFSPSAGLPPLTELLNTLENEDWFDRAQAAKSLGHWVTPRTIDPLLKAFRVSRSPLVRREAFLSLRRVIQLLPLPLAEYELTTRLVALKEKANDESLYLGIAALYDVLGQVDLALSEYQKALVADAPDPIILWRLVELRAERGQFFSSALVARSLAVHAQQILDEQVTDNASALVRVQHSCASVHLTRLALSTIAQAKSKGGKAEEFAQDINDFERKAQATLNLAQAKLRDAQLQALADDALAHTCDTDPAGARFSALERQRLGQLVPLLKSTDEKTRFFLDMLKTRDWSTELRQAIETAQAAWPKKK